MGVMTGIGDSSSVDLWQTHATELVRYATLLVGPSEAADVVSFAFSKLLASPDRTDVDNARAFLFRIVTNTALDQLRSDKRRQRRDLFAVVPEQTNQHAALIDIRRAVAGLGLPERVVVYFTYWEDLDASAIAAMLGINVGSVRRRLARARFQLRKVLE